MNTKTIRHGACTIIIRRPELTAAEGKAREQATRDTLAQVLRSYTARKEAKHEQTN
jgi:hypothetical protein